MEEEVSVEEAEEAEEAEEVKEAEQLWKSIDDVAAESD